jgi:biotin carboxylase
MNWRVLVAAAAICREIQDMADRCLQVDLRDKEAVAGLAQTIKQEQGLDGVFTAGTDFSTTVAWVAEQTGLPGIPFATALAATDKSLMRRTFREKGVPSPHFATVQRAAGLTIKDFLKGLSFPLVVKPVDNMGARGVRRVDDTVQLQRAVEEAVQHSASRQAIVEEYLEGPELSLDAVIHEGQISICGVADRHICFPPYFVEMGHTMPSGLDPRVLGGAEEVFLRGIQALGINQGAAKGDIKITAEGPVIGEIAARLSGGYMSGWTFPFASGVEVTEAALNIAVGLPPGDLRPKRSWVSAERAFISIPGIVKALEGIQQARDVPGIRELFLRVSPGQQVTLPINNMGKCGNLISAAATRSEALEAAATAVGAILVRLETDNPRTDAFLSGKEQGGFSAYPTLSPEIRRELKNRPLWLGEPEHFSGEREDLYILELPGISKETAKDWHGISLESACRRAMEISELGMPEGRCPRSAPASPHKPEDRTPYSDISTERALQILSDSPSKLILGRVFWNALIKGGVQAGVYVIDSLCNPADKPKHVVEKWLA